MSERFTLSICQGKYKYTYDNGKQSVLRNNEPWAAMNEQLIGNKFVYSLAVEADELAKELAACKKERDEWMALSQRQLVEYEQRMEQLAALDEFDGEQ